MLIQIPKEEFWKLFKTLPEEIKEAIFSPETHETLSRIEEKYQLDEKSGIFLGRATINVLLGLLSPDEFKETLIEEGGFPKEIANSINHEVWRYIFFPIKSQLETFYTKAKESEKKPFEIPTFLKEKEEEKPKPKIDIYREPIE